MLASAFLVAVLLVDVFARLVQRFADDAWKRRSPKVYVALVLLVVFALLVVMLIFGWLRLWAFAIDEVKVWIVPIGLGLVWGMLHVVCLAKAWSLPGSSTQTEVAGQKASDQEERQEVPQPEGSSPQSGERFGKLRTLAVMLHFAAFIVPALLLIFGETVAVSDYLQHEFVVLDKKIPVWLMLSTCSIMWFLGMPSNDTVRALVDLGGRRNDSSPKSGVGFVARILPDRSSRAFVGGRLLGPMERFIAVISILSGAFVVIGAILAAKGIIRFPEIQSDAKNGDKAEVFLVGSMGSFLFALLGALVIRLAL